MTKKTIEDIPVKFRAYVESIDIAGGYCADFDGDDGEHYVVALKDAATFAATGAHTEHHKRWRDILAALREGIEIDPAVKARMAEIGEGNPFALPDDVRFIYAVAGLDVDIEDNDEPYFDGAKNLTTYRADIIGDPRYVFAATDCYCIATGTRRDIIDQLRDGARRLDPKEYDDDPGRDNDELRALDARDAAGRAAVKSATMEKKGTTTMKQIKTLSALKTAVTKKFGKWADTDSRVFAAHRVRSIEAIGGDDYEDHECDPAGAIGYVEVMYFGPTVDDIKNQRDVSSDDDMAIRDWIKSVGLEIVETSDVTGEGAHDGGKDYWVRPVAEAAK